MRHTILVILIIVHPINPLSAQLESTPKENASVLQKNALHLMPVPHPLTRPSGHESLILLEQVRKKPVEYTPEIERLARALILLVKDKRKTSPDRLKELGISDGIIDDLLHARHVEADPLGRLGACLGLLNEVNSPSAVALAGTLFVEMDELLGMEDDPKQREKLNGFQRGIVHYLDTRQDRRVVSLVLKYLPQLKYYNRGIYYLYLQKSCIGDKWVIGELESLIKNEDSPLHDDSEAKKTLELLTRPIKKENSDGQATAK